MRIISGSARGKKLITPEGLDVRPTIDRVKEAVFSSLQFDIEGRRILDLFAGCGTTLVEAKVHAISSVGVDINPVAQLITKVKTTPLAPDALQQAYTALVNLFDK